MLALCEVIRKLLHCTPALRKKASQWTAWGLEGSFDVFSLHKPREDPFL